jgi:beta-alanine degradation protein BauB
LLTPEDIATNPIGTDLIFEDDRVRIWQIVLEPGQEAPVHTHHLDYTTITVEPSTLERLNGDGSIDRSEGTAGKVSRWYRSTRTHGLRNVGTTRFRNVIVELKGVPANFDREDDQSAKITE